MDKREEMERELEKRGVKFVQLTFMDILGAVKSVSIPFAKFRKSVDEGITFDASSVAGYATIQESDMRAIPILSTLQLLPWAMNATARFTCSIHYPNGDRFPGDPRYALERLCEKYKKYSMNVGPECEFFLFRMDGDAPTTDLEDHGGYFDLLPLDRGEKVRQEIVKNLEALGIEVEASHHEVAPSQHEIDFVYSDALSTADRVSTLIQTTKTTALAYGLYATFMPKPLYGINGSGMHVHLSLFDEGRNVFDDPDGRWGISELGLNFLGGLIDHAREISGVLSSWANSYKRLVPGYEAPTYISWANLNRSAWIRVPQGRGEKTRFEVRSPDPAGNPYLQFAVLLRAGMDGIERGLEPPDPVEKDIYSMSKGERAKFGIEPLPENLGEALREMGRSELVKEVLGDHIFGHFMTFKEREWDEYKARLTQWEVDKYLHIL
jgi:glutamine synthetase